MKKNNINWSTCGYDGYSYRKTMLKGTFLNQVFISDFYDHLWITPISIWWAKIKVYWRFKALFGNVTTASGKPQMYTDDPNYKGDKKLNSQKSVDYSLYGGKVLGSEVKIGKWKGSF